MKRHTRNPLQTCVVNAVRSLRSNSPVATWRLENEFRLYSKAIINDIFAVRTTGDRGIYVYVCVERYKTILRYSRRSCAYAAACEACKCYFINIYQLPKSKFTIRKWNAFAYVRGIDVVFYNTITIFFFFFVPSYDHFY